MGLIPSLEVLSDIRRRIRGLGYGPGIIWLRKDITRNRRSISVALTSIIDFEQCFYHFEDEYKMAKKYIEDFEREEAPELVEQLKGDKKE